MAASTPVPAVAAIHFHEVARAWGIDFRHHHGGSGRRFLPETTAGGVVMLDYDGDGDEDLFFVDGGKLPGYQGEEPRSRLYRNEGGGRFLDVTAGSGLAVRGYGFGGTAGDVDGDGDLDLFVTQYGADQLFRNEGDGTFTDVTAASGASDPLWSSSAGFADADRDGDLDLYVANYVAYDVTKHGDCTDRQSGISSYCAPLLFPSLPHHYYRNRGEGTFEDRTAAAGFASAVGAGLGVVWGDVDNDGWPDLYVANDADPNFLFHNRGDGTFEDIALVAGVALSPRGIPEGGMGTDLGDYDGDGLLDLFVANSDMEHNALYRNLGGGNFSDQRFQAGVAEPSLFMVGFGMAWADVDHDADLDLVVANGHILDNAPQLRAGSLYEQPNHVYENLGNGRFRLAEGTGMDVLLASRAMANGDLDGDGDLDFVEVNMNERTEVYAGEATGAWLLVDLEGRASNRAGIGSRLELAALGKTQIRDVKTASSFQAQNAITVHFGVAGAAAVEGLTVRWPSGKVQRLLDLPARRRLRISEP